jgi:hypothetical protein
VRQTNVLRRQVFPLGGPRRELLQLSDLFFELDALVLALRELLLCLRGERLESPPRAIRLGGLARQILRAGVRVQQLALRRGPQQRLVQMLAVDVQQVGARVRQLRQRRRVPVDEAARAPAAIQRAPQQQRAGVSREIMLVEPGREWAARIDLELGGQLGAPSPRPLVRRPAARARRRGSTCPRRSRR